MKYAGAPQMISAHLYDAIAALDIAGIALADNGDRWCRSSDGHSDGRGRGGRKNAEVHEDEACCGGDSGEHGEVAVRSVDV